MNSKTTCVPVERPLFFDVCTTGVSMFMSSLTPPSSIIGSTPLEASGDSAVGTISGSMVSVCVAGAACWAGAGGSRLGLQLRSFCNSKVPP